MLHAPDIRQAAKRIQIESAWVSPLQDRVKIYLIYSCFDFFLHGLLLSLYGDYEDALILSQS